MALRPDDISINTLIGEGSFVAGDMKVNGFIRIDGDIDGNIETDGQVIIGEKARIRGNITAESVTVGGIVLGDITATTSVQLLGTSAVCGDIFGRRVQIADKVVFQGRCISVNDPQRLEEETARYLEEKAIRTKAVLT